MLQHTGDKGARIRTPDGGCLAVVLRTGFETAQGLPHFHTVPDMIPEICVQQRVLVLISTLR